jgi:hypothetical protein
MRLFCVCVVLCLARGLATSCSLVQESYRLWKIITELKIGQGPEGAGRAIEKKRFLFRKAVWHLCGDERLPLTLTKEHRETCTNTNSPSENRTKDLSVWPLTFRTLGTETSLWQEKEFSQLGLTIDHIYRNRIQRSYRYYQRKHWILSTMKLTNFVDQSPFSELLCSLRISCLLWKTEVPWAYPFWASWIQPTSSQPVSPRSIQVSSFLRLGFGSGVFPSGLTITILDAFLTSPLCASRSDNFIFLDLITLIIFNSRSQ